MKLISALFILIIYTLTAVITSAINDELLRYKSSVTENIIHNNSLYYLTTDEGLLSHFRQLEIVWNAIHQKRQVISVGFNSSHYPNVSNIVLCDIFTLPSDIICLKVQPIDIIRKYTCIYSGLIHPSERYYGVKLVTNSSFNYKTEKCIAGGINTDVGFPIPINRKSMIKYPIFTKKYESLMSITRTILNVTFGKTSYIVAHWRRGDQLSTKCRQINTSNKRRIDYSINCGNVSEFVNHLKRDISNHIRSDKVKFIYIATNEKNPNDIKYLNKQGYKTYADIKAGFDKRNMSINSLNAFVIELMVMCDSTYLFAWGESGAHNFLYHCRTIDVHQRHVTVIDDPRSLGYGQQVNNYRTNSDYHIHNRD